MKSVKQNELLFVNFRHILDTIKLENTSTPLEEAWLIEMERQLLHICLGTVTEALGLTPLTEQASAPHHHFQGQVDQFLPSMTILEHLQEELFLRLIAELLCQR